MKTAAFEISKYFTEALSWFFSPRLPPVPFGWWEKYAPSLLSLITQKHIFSIFWLPTRRIFYRGASGRRQGEGEKREVWFSWRAAVTATAVEWPSSFFFCIRPSARDYSPQWLWITCGGLARSPVTKSFWRISRPPTVTPPLLSFFLFCFLLHSLYGVRVSVTAKVTLWAKTKKVWGRGGSHSRHNLLVTSGGSLASGRRCGRPSKWDYSPSDFAANQAGRFDYFSL